MDGDLPTGFVASATVFYDGRGQVDQLDTELFAQTSPSEDSVLLVWRTAPGQSWQEYPTYLKNKLSSPTDRYGSIRIDNLRLGQYAIAKGKSTVPTNEPARGYMELTISPNPTDSAIQLTAPEPFDRVLLMNTEGKKIREWSLQRVTSTTIDVKDVPAGSYWLVALGKTQHGAAGIIVQH